MDTLLQDLTYAWRSVRKTAAVSAIAVLCLGIGIGVNATMFSTVHCVFLRPFAFRDPERIVVLTDRHVRSARENVRLSYVNLLDWQRRGRSFEQLAGVRYEAFAFAGGAEVERVPGAAVSWNMFPLLGVGPVLGRGFDRADDRAGAVPVALLSDVLWRERFGSDPGVIGQRILLDGHPYTVIGVMPPRFEFPFRQRVWVTLDPVAHASRRDDRFFQVFARLERGVTLAAARAEAAAIAARLAEDYPEANRGWTTWVSPLREQFMPDMVRLMVGAMMAVAWCILLIACFNVTNLMLVRASGRSREMAIRSAIGAGRGRLVRQLLTESVVIGLMGGGVGILIAAWGVDAMRAGFPPGVELPYYVYWSLDGPTLAYAGLVSGLTGVLFGLAPALQASRPDVNESLKDGARMSGGPGRARLRGALVVAEVGLSLVCLVAAALFVRSSLHVQRVDPGFDASRLLTLRVELAGSRYDATRDRTRAVQQLVARLEQLPGIEAVGASNAIALGSGGARDGVVAEGTPHVIGEEPRVFYTGVTAGWLGALGVTLTAGRPFTRVEESDSSAVAIVNQAMASMMWPKQNAVGKRFRLIGEPTRQWITVAGVAPDFHVEDIDDQVVGPAAFLPYPYQPSANTALTIRTTGAPLDVAPAVRAAIRGFEPAAPVFDVETMNGVRRLAAWEYPYFTKMFSVFGAIALVLAIIGLYGVVSYGVSQRTHEIGVRMALGARHTDVLRLVLGQGLRLAGAGVGMGALAAAGVAQMIQSQLYRTSPTDLASYVAIAVVLGIAAVAASYFPARRAALIEPMAALREE